MHFATMQADLHHTLASPGCRDLLDRLRPDHPALATCSTWGAVIEVVQRNGLLDSDLDALLTALIGAYAHEPDQRWSSILCAVSFRWLVASHRPRSAWLGDPEEVWQELVLTFLEVCRRAAAQGRTTRLRRYLVYQTQHRLYESCVCRWRAQQEIPTDPQRLPRRAGEDGEARHRVAQLDRLEDQERQRALLQRQCALGLLLPIDVAIITSTRIDGQTIIDVAARLGVPPAMATKRRQRAEKAMRAFTARGAIRDSVLPAPPSGAFLWVPRRRRRRVGSVHPEVSP